MDTPAPDNNVWLRDVTPRGNPGFSATADEVRALRPAVQRSVDALAAAPDRWSRECGDDLTELVSATIYAPSPVAWGALLAVQRLVTALLHPDAPGGTEPP